MSSSTPRSRIAFARQALKKHIPDVVIRSIHKLNDNGEKLTLEVNGRWIVRFPFDDLAREGLAGEARLLALLRGRITTGIPEICWHVADTGFDGYEKLPGAPLPSRRLQALNEEQRGAFGDAIGRFLAEIHATPLDAAGDLQLPPLRWNWGPFAENLHARLKNLFPSRPEARLVEYAMELRDSVRPDPSDLVLIHGDLHGEPRRKPQGLSPWRNARRPTRRRTTAERSTAAHHARYARAVPFRKGGCT